MVCRWAVLSLQVPLYTELLDGLCSFLCALVRFPGQPGRRLYSVMSRATNWILCPGTVGKAALKPAKLFVVLTQTNEYPKFYGPTGPLALLCKLWALPALLSLTATGLHSFQELSPAILVRWHWKAPSTKGWTVTQHLAQAWQTRLWGQQSSKFEDPN